MGRKIAVLGAHGTGKTTMVLRMAAQLKDENPGERVGIVSEVVRSCPFPINAEATEETQAWIFHQQFVREIEAAARYEVVICDRTVLDAMAYSYFAQFYGQVEACMPAALAWMRTYDELYLMRPQRLPTDDGVRDTSLHFQSGVDQILCRWIRRYGLVVSEINI